MPEWLVEEGIGEDRAVLLDGDGIAAARVRWPGAGLVAGEIADAVLQQRLGQGRAGLVVTRDGEPAFVPLVPRPVSLGAPLRVAVTREAMAERGRLKLAQARVTDAAPRPAPSLAASLRETGADAKVVHRFPAGTDWNELWLDAAAQEVTFHGGALLFAETPAMTLVDVDGGPLEAIRSNGVPALARALQRFDLAGNIGIDFPTVQDKADRQTIDRTLADCLQGWPHERTAMNGFGFVQIVARLSRPSLLHRIARHRAGAAARLLLRRAEALDGAGRIELAAHPAVITALNDEWLDELRRRTGRDVSTRPDPTLAFEAAHAQLVQQ